MGRRRQIPQQSTNRVYLDYYLNQAGKGLPRYQGTQTQYGFGLGSILRSIIRSIIPFGNRVVAAVKPAAKAAFNIAKPHLKEAAKDLTKAAITNIASRLNQQGEGRKRRATPITRKRSHIPPKRRHRVNRALEIPDIF